MVPSNFMSSNRIEIRVVDRKNKKTKSVTCYDPYRDYKKLLTVDEVLTTIKIKVLSARLTEKPNDNLRDTKGYY